MRIDINFVNKFFLFSLFDDNEKFIEYSIVNVDSLDKLKNIDITLFDNIILKNGIIFEKKENNIENIPIRLLSGFLSLLFDNSLNDSFSIFNSKLSYNEDFRIDYTNKQFFLSLDNKIWFEGAESDYISYGSLLYDVSNSFIELNYYFKNDNDENDTNKYFPFTFFDFKFSNQFILSFFNSLNSIDLSTIETKIESMENKIIKDFSYNISNILNNLNDIKGSISHIKFDFDEKSFLNSLKSFFTFNLSNLSLNGSNGAKFSDGEKVVIDGYSGIWEIVGSFQIVVDDNNLTISYLVKRDDKSMIVPSAFVSNQGA